MLTDTQIKRAMKEAKADVTLTDGGAGRGSGSLKLRIRPTVNGVTATWLVQWKQDGQRAFKPLGRYPDMTGAQARAVYSSEVAPLLLAGKDPRVVVAATGKPTVERMFQAFVDNLKAKGLVSHIETERMLLLAKYNAADALGRTRLASSIDPADVAAYVSRFFQRGSRGAADKARAYVSAAFNWAIRSTHDYTVASREDWGVKVNPAAAVKRDSGAIRHRDRNLSAAELATLWRDAHEGTENWTAETAACIRMLILCGQRVQETLRIEGKEIDLDAALWTMPAEKTKGKKRAHTVPLPRRAVEVLRPLKELHGDGPLFPARPGSAGRFIDHRSIMQVIDRWNTGKIQPFQTRDLRRTWKSRTGEIGISKEIRDIIQQHTRRDIGSKAYDRADYLPQMREAMAKWEDWLDQVLEPDQLQVDVAA